MSKLKRLIIYSLCSYIPGVHQFFNSTIIGGEQGFKSQLINYLEQIQNGASATGIGIALHAWVINERKEGQLMLRCMPCGDN
jgi:hypothetical protein